MYGNDDSLERTNRLVEKINRVINGEVERGGWNYAEVLGVLAIVKSEMVDGLDDVLASGRELEHE